MEKLSISKTVVYTFNTKSDDSVGYSMGGHMQPALLSFVAYRFMSLKFFHSRGTGGGTSLRQWFSAFTTR